VSSRTDSLLVGHVVGLDLGSTYIKGVLVDAAGAEVATARRPSPWQSLPQGCAEMEPGRLLDAVGEVLVELAATGREVAAIGVSGMAESGVLLDRADGVVGPVVAWFDPRGGDDVADLPEDLRADFAGVTGLPLGPLATFTKLWHRSRRLGLDLSGRQWLNVPELVAWWLGGVRRAEVSLAARTGLLDQDTGRVWSRAVEVLGADPDLVPALAPAGSSWGTASRHVPAPMAGAVLTVAGHDHLVSSAAAVVLDLDTLYDSMGTAEALVRVLEGVLDRPARERLAAHGINVVRHFLPDRGVMLAGTKSGLLMRRVLQLVGVEDVAGRSALDDQVLALPPAAADTGVEVRGAANDDGVLTVRTDSDGLSPALLFHATLRDGRQVLSEVLARMDAEAAPAVRSVVAGGWTRMRCVRRARQDLLPAPAFSDRDEDTAYGAALVAAFAATPGEGDLADFLARSIRATAGSVAGQAAHHTTPEGTAR
jgi:sugar (pentulose or hexulose) kinase